MLDILLILYFFTRKENELEMLALLYAQKIMLEKRVFSKTPKPLKAQVAEILIESGYEHLIDEEEYLHNED